MANVILTLVVLLSGLVFVAHADKVVDRCVVCSTISNEECRNPSVGTFISACPANNNACISRIVGEHIIRSCLYSLTADEVTSCVSGTCNLCYDNGCNNEPYAPVTPPPRRGLLCHRCSGRADSSCAGNISGSPSECPYNIADEQCYIARPNGNYERGCLSSPNRCASESCFRCKSDGCNSQDYNSANDIYSMTKMITFAILSVIIIMFNK